jgi:hypothetical protein
MASELPRAPARSPCLTRTPGGRVSAQRSPDPSGVPLRPSAGTTSRRLPHSVPGAAGVPEAASGTPLAPSALIYGENRALVNLVLYALAEEANPRFRWLEVRSPEPSSSHWDPVQLGWIPEGRVWSTDPTDGLAPDRARTNAAIFELVRSDEAPATLQRLADFLRLPDSMQRIFAELTPASAPHLLAVANVDRIAGSFPESTLGPILDAMEWARCSLFAGFVGGNPPVHPRFTHVVRVAGTSPEHWQEAYLHFERESLFKGLRLGGVASPLDLPAVARVFRRASG